MSTLVQLAREIYAKLTVPGVTWIVGVVAMIAAIPFVPREWLEEGAIGDGSALGFALIAFTVACVFWQWRRNSQRQQ